MVWDRHGKYPARVEAFEPPNYLAWRWTRDPGTDLEGGVTTLVEFRLTAREGGGTVLDLHESGFVRSADRKSNESGWDHELGELAEYLQDVSAS